VQIICPKCQAEYDLDPPAAPFARDQDLVFRCSACSTAISLKREEPAIPAVLEDEPDTDIVEAPPPVDSFILLRQDASTYRVENTAQLQRWIAERRIWPDDEVAVDGGGWCRVGDIEAYAVFFKLVEDAERVQGEAPERAESPRPEPPKQPSLSVSVKPGLFARPSSLDPMADVATQSPPAEGTTVVDVAPVLEVESAPVDEHSPPESPAVAEVHAAFGEVVPEEEPRPLLTPDQPTMDMELEEDDFFSEEAAAGHHGGGLDGDDDILEWGQQRRKNMVMWWLMFFGALGGAAYLALDFLNARDAQVQPAAVEAVPDVQPDVEAPSAEAPSEGGDTGTAAALDSVEAEPKPETTDEAEPKPAATDEAEPKAEVPDPEPEPTKPAAPPPPKKPSASTEVTRGWSQIDRENWTKARVHFDSALRLEPANPDARLGMAYVNEHQGRMGEAVAQYCRLSATASGEVKIEAQGRLRALAKDCP